MAAMFPGGMPGGMPAAEPPKEVDNGKMIDLLDKIDKQDTYAKNESASFPMTNLFIGDSRLGCKSDADEQLILHISFQEFVKVWTVCVIRKENKTRRRWEQSCGARILLTTSISLPGAFTQVYRIQQWFRS